MSCGYAGVNRAREMSHGSWLHEYFGERGSPLGVQNSTVSALTIIAYSLFQKGTVRTLNTCKQKFLACGT